MKSIDMERGSMQKMSSFEFQAKLTDQIVNTFRVLNIAFITGVIFFAGMILFLWSSQNIAVQSGDSSMKVLSVITAAIFAVCVSLSFRIPARTLETVSSEINGDLAFEIAIAKIRTCMIMRIAFLEAPALFGLAIMIIAINNGTLAAQPIYALNMIPAAVMIITLVMLMPSKERIVSWYDMIS
jgi:hypothetical protein